MSVEGRGRNAIEFPFIWGALGKGGKEITSDGKGCQDIQPPPFMCAAPDEQDEVGDGEEGLQAPGQGGGPGGA